MAHTLNRYMQKSPDFFYFFEKIYYQDMKSKTTNQFEFLKIYGITLVAVFILTTTVKYQMGSSTFSELVKPEVPTASTSPIAEVDNLLPFKKLKKIFVNLSF